MSEKYICNPKKFDEKIAVVSVWICFISSIIGILLSKTDSFYSMLDSFIFFSISSIVLLRRRLEKSHKNKMGQDYKRGNEYYSMFVGFVIQTLVTIIILFFTKSLFVAFFSYITGLIVTYILFQILIMTRVKTEE
jgi:hypothetical protein